jgi:hypothetical protein
MPCIVSGGEGFKKIRSVIERVCREAWVKMFHAFEVCSPAADRKVSRAYDEVGLIRRGKRNHLGMKAAVLNGNRFNLVATPGVSRAVF